MQCTYDWLKGRVGKPLSPSDCQKVEEIADRFGYRLNKRCPNCYNDAIIVILTTLRKMKKNRQRYAMQRGVAFRYNGVIYTSANITDEAARWWLSQDGRNARYITELPQWIEGKVAEAPMDETEIKQQCDE